jgi:uncharacterized protein (DUF1810 family)
MAHADSPGSLDRFRAAQSGANSGYAAALAEVRGGRKTGHWIWYVFPQLRGLGHSGMSQHYGVAGPAEAEAYLRDPELGERLSQITRALEAHVCAPAAPKTLNRVLGGIDALKVVSSLTLFVGVAPRLGDAPPPWVAAFRESAERVLDAAAREGLDRCTFTLRALAEAGRP